MKYPHDTNNLTFMTTYKEYISYLAENKIDKNFINSDYGHAVDVFETLFENAQKSVKILAGSLTSEVSNDQRYLLAISDFIERGGELKILLTDYDGAKAKSSNLFKRLFFYKFKERPVFVKQTKVIPYYSSDPDKKEIHFTVADKTSFRIENDTIERKANYCNFNNKSTAENLTVFFDEVFDSPESVDVCLISLFKES